MGTQGIPGMSGEKGAKVMIHFMSFRNSVHSKCKHLEVGLKKRLRLVLKPLFRSIDRFHSRGQHLCKFIVTKESVCIRKEFNSHGTGVEHQHGRRLIVLGHQYGPP